MHAAQRPHSSPLTGFLVTMHPQLAMSFHRVLPSPSGRGDGEHPHITWEYSVIVRSVENLAMDEAAWMLRLVHLVLLAYVASTRFWASMYEGKSLIRRYLSPFQVPASVVTQSLSTRPQNSEWARSSPIENRPLLISWKTSCIRGSIG